jgi:hypothetical protein
MQTKEIKREIFGEIFGESQWRGPQKEMKTW